MTTPSPKRAARSSFSKKVTVSALTACLLGGAFAGTSGLAAATAAPTSVSITTVTPTQTPASAQSHPLAQGQQIPVQQRQAPAQGQVPVQGQAPAQGEQIGQIARQIINWVRQQGAALWNSFTRAVSAGWRAVSTWLSNQLPSFLRDVAVALGLDIVAQWIVNNWPF